MRNMFIVVVLTTLTLAAADTALAGPTAPRWARLRPLTPTAAAILADAIHRSSIVEALVAVIERSDVVVYLTDSMAGLEAEPATYLRFVASASGLRYVLLRIDRWRLLSASERASAIGHELQHAVEIAGAPDVRDSASLVRLYRQIGWEHQEGHFETERARSVGNRVRAELGGFGPDAARSSNSKNTQQPPGTTRGPQ